jgi:hypothetical protein
MSLTCGFVLATFSPRDAGRHLCAAFCGLGRGGARPPQRRDQAAAHRHPVGYQHAGHGRARIVARRQGAAPGTARDDGDAYGDDKHRRRAAEYGAMEFVTKPVDFELLITQRFRWQSVSAN